MVLTVSYDVASERPPRDVSSRTTGAARHCAGASRVPVTQLNKLPTEGSLCITHARWK